MLERYVYLSRHDASGRAVALLNRSASWSPRSTDAAIDDIESRRVRYLIDWVSGPVELEVRHGPDGAQLDAPGPDGLPGGLKELPRA